MSLKVILAGHGDAREILRPITTMLRQSGVMASAFLNEHVPFATRELDDTNFFLLGLSPESQKDGSEEHGREEFVLEMIAKLVQVRKIPCGLVSDANGRIEITPALHVHSRLFGLVATDDSAFDPMGLFGQYRVPRDPSSIAHAIREFLQTPVRAIA